METLHTLEALRAFTAAWRRAGDRIALVPTMGNLHEGHLGLVRHARGLADAVVASVFVNPMQFGPGEDFESYPRTLEADRERLQAEGTDALFAPGADELYPRGTEGHTRVHVPGLSEVLCGASRPGHFDGVATVVAKLLGAAEPDVAVFGEKDFQQLQVVRRMVADLCMNVAIEGAPTARAPDGLALSSRNAYLDAEERERAPALHRTLEAVRERLEAGERDFAALERDAAAALERHGFRPDYVAVRRRSDLAVPAAGDDDLVVLAAAHLGRARLIDNVRAGGG